MSVHTGGLETTLHRLANHVECSLAEIVTQLLAESRHECAAGILSEGSRMIDALRYARDCGDQKEKGGDDES